MTDPTLLGALSSLHEMMSQLVLSLSPKEAAHPYHPELGSLTWQLGRSVFLETYWLREAAAGDDSLTGRVRHLFTPGELPMTEQCAALPPVDHLLNWAAEIQEEHLMRLANPRLMPDHPLLKDDRLGWFLVQEQAKHYERMLMLLCQRQLQGAADPDYRVERPLAPQPPIADAQEMVQCHFRIGAREPSTAYDNELPPQAVELSTFRVARRPVSNAEYLMFMQEDGYRTRDWWDEEGWAWLGAAAVDHPEYWRRDPAGRWYGIGVNGTVDLHPDEPVLGLSRHEATAFAAWTAARGGELAGAVLQHEYQWEVAARTGALKNQGRVQEWCKNPFHPYPEFKPFPGPEVSQAFFDGHHVTLRGGSLHTQRPLRRISFRDWRRPEQRFGFAGLRLVFPPSY